MPLSCVPTALVQAPTRLPQCQPQSSHAWTGAGRLLVAQPAHASMQKCKHVQEPYPGGGSAAAPPRRLLIWAAPAAACVGPRTKSTSTWTTPEVAQTSSGDSTGPRSRISFREETPTVAGRRRHGQAPAGHGAWDYLVRLRAVAARRVLRRRLLPDSAVGRARRKGDPAQLFMLAHT